MNHDWTVLKWQPLLLITTDHHCSIKTAISLQAQPRYPGDTADSESKSWWLDVPYNPTDFLVRRPHVSRSSGHGSRTMTAKAMGKPNSASPMVSMRIMASTGEAPDQYTWYPTGPNSLFIGQTCWETDGNLRVLANKESMIKISGVHSWCTFP